MRQGLGDQLVEPVRRQAVKGYVDQRMDEPTEDPQAAVMQDGEMVAIVHLRGADGSPTMPYTTISLVEACADAFAPTTSTTAATAVPPRPARPQRDPPRAPQLRGRGVVGRLA